MSDQMRDQAPELTAVMRAEVERFGIHPELTEVTAANVLEGPMQLWLATLSDDELDYEIKAASARIEAVQHTKRSLTRELIRRHTQAGKAS